MIEKEKIEDTNGQDLEIEIMIKEVIIIEIENDY